MTVRLPDSLTAWQPGILTVWQFDTQSVSQSVSQAVRQSVSQSVSQSVISFQYEKVDIPGEEFEVEVILSAGLGEHDP